MRTRLSGTVRPGVQLLLALLCAGLAQFAGAAQVAPETMLSREAAREWRAVGRVNIAGTHTLRQCTGALIAPQIVLTAAHCLVHPKTGKAHPLGTIHFVAGWYSGDLAGHGRAQALALHPDYVPGDHTVDGLAKDIGLILLREPLPALAADPFVLSAPPQPGTPLTLVSYRRDRAQVPTLQTGCPYRKQAGPLLIFACPVMHGASGAPVFAVVDGQQHLVGVLAARSGTPDDPLGVAVRADEAVKKLLEMLR